MDIQWRFPDATRKLSQECQHINHKLQSFRNVQKANVDVSYEDNTLLGYELQNTLAISRLKI